MQCTDLCINMSLKERNQEQFLIFRGLLKLHSGIFFFPCHLHGLPDICTQNCSVCYPVVVRKERNSH